MARYRNEDATAHIESFKNWGMDGQIVDLGDLGVVKINYLTIHPPVIKLLYLHGAWDS